MTLVSLVDDHRLFSASLTLALRAEGLAVHIPPLTSLATVRDAVLERHPDVVLLDRDLGALGDGEDLLPQIAGAGYPVMVISATLDDVVAGRCLEAGATACLGKWEPLEAVMSAIAALVRGEALIPPAERHRLLSAWHRWRAAGEVAAGPFAQLTPREAFVLAQLIRGRSVKVIASAAHVSTATVRTQVRAILTKLNVSSQLEAVALALHARWDPPLGSEEAAPRATPARSEDRYHPTVR